MPCCWLEAQGQLMHVIMMAAEDNRMLTRTRAIWRCCAGAVLLVRPVGSKDLALLWAAVPSLLLTVVVVLLWCSVELLGEVQELHVINLLQLISGLIVEGTCSVRHAAVSRLLAARSIAARGISAGLSLIHTCLDVSGAANAM